jgi:hypothetical protein
LRPDWACAQFGVLLWRQEGHLGQYTVVLPVSSYQLHGEKELGLLGSISQRKAGLFVHGVFYLLVAVGVLVGGEIPLVVTSSTCL